MLKAMNFMSIMRAKNYIFTEEGSARSNEAGSALVYILIAIALLAALTISFMNPSSNQTSSQNTFRAVSEIESQIEYIRSAVQECVLRSSIGGTVAGDNTIDNTSTGTDPGASFVYPLAPNSTHLAAPVATNRNVSNLRCPSDPGDSNNHGAIFGGASGKFLPPSPSLFNNWKWYNGTDGVFFWIDTSATDAFIGTVLTKLNEKFSVCEADVIDATGGAEFLDEDSTLTCPNGSRCFRVWMVTDTTNGGGNVEDGSSDPQAAHYPTPVDAAEAACDINP